MMMMTMARIFELVSTMMVLVVLLVIVLLRKW